MLQDDGKDKDKRPGSSKLAEKAKKKAWYSVLYPSYKSRAEDFKKLFKDVPDDERLVVGESLSIVNKTKFIIRTQKSNNPKSMPGGLIFHTTFRSNKNRKKRKKR